MIRQAPEGHDGVGGFNSTYLKNISQIGSFPQVGAKKYPASFNLGVGDFSRAFAVKLRGEVFVQLVVW